MRLRGIKRSRTAQRFARAQTEACRCGGAASTKTSTVLAPTRGCRAFRSRESQRLIVLHLPMHFFAPRQRGFHQGARVLLCLEAADLAAKPGANTAAAHCLSKLKPCMLHLPAEQTGLHIERPVAQGPRRRYRAFQRARHEIQGCLVHRCFCRRACNGCIAPS